MEVKLVCGLLSPSYSDRVSPSSLQSNNNGNLWYRCEILYIIEITEINDLTVRVTVLVQEKDRDALASLVTRTEKESFLQSEVRRYLHAP